MSFRLAYICRYKRSPSWYIIPNIAANMIRPNMRNTSSSSIFLDRFTQRYVRLPAEIMATAKNAKMAPLNY